MIPFILSAVGGYLIGDSMKRQSFAKGGKTKESFLHIYKVKYPNYNKIYVYDGDETPKLTPLEVMNKMRIQLYPNYGAWATSYKYSGVPSDSDKYKKWYQLKKKDYTDEEAYKKVFEESLYADGGETDDDDMSVQFIDYKDKMIMFEPHFKKYYSNDIEFDSLEAAKKYIDSGSKRASWEEEAYRRGLMAKGGEVKFEDKVNAVKKKLEGTEVPKRLRKDYGKKYSKEEAEMAAKRIIGAQVKKYGE